MNGNGNGNGSGSGSLNYASVRDGRGPCPAANPHGRTACTHLTMGHRVCPEERDLCRLSMAAKSTPASNHKHIGKDHLMTSPGYLTKKQDLPQGNPNSLALPPRLMATLLPLTPSRLLTASHLRRIRVTHIPCNTLAIPSRLSTLRTAIVQSYRIHSTSNLLGGLAKKGLLHPPSHITPAIRDILNRRDLDIWRKCRTRWPRSKTS